MRLSSLWLGLGLLLPSLALAQGASRKNQLTPEQMREIEKQLQKIQEAAEAGREKDAQKKAKEGTGKDKKEAKPRPPPNCRLPGPKRAAQFSEKELPDMPLAERYAEYVGVCALADVVALTKQLVAFKTVSSEQPAAKNPGIAAMGRFLQQWAKAHGFGFRVVGANDVFELSWGEGAPHLGLVFHGDVVPAPAHEWKYKPFELQVKDGRLYGRGVIDDKGPIATALVTMAMAKELGLQPQKGKVLVIIGNGEESDWKGMQEYARTEALPTHVVSVDADYPVVVAQSGFVALNLEAEVGTPGEKDEGRLLAVNATAGEFLTQVPAAASVELVPTSGTSLEQGLAAVRTAVDLARREHPSLVAEVKTVRGTGRAEGSRIVLSTQGKAVHSSTPEQGHNALWGLASVADRLPLVDNGVSAMLQTVSRRFAGDHHGERLGFTEKDPLMGRLSSAPTLLRVKDGKVSLGINLRRPRSEEGTEDFHMALNHAVSLITQESDGRVKEGPGRFVGEPHVAEVSGPLVSTLLDIYKRHRNLRGEVAPISLRGGTYARLFPRGVDFGPGLPGEPYTGHAPDESISLEHLALNTQMIAAVLHALALSAHAR